MEPLYMQIYHKIREEIQKGVLQAGEKLPSRRALAEAQGVSIRTAESAYEQLLAEGFICARPKSGYFVLEMETLLAAPRVPPDTQPEPRKAAQFAVDFSARDTEPFPEKIWRRAVRKGMEESTLDQPLPAKGDAGLCASVVDYVLRSRGVRCRPEQVIIGAGTDALLQMLAGMMGRDSTAIVENPVYNRAARIFSQMGQQVLPIAVDEKGLPPHRLPEKDGCLVYLTPSHQFPLGFSMPISRRVRLLNWAGRGSERILIEDDYDSEFRHKGRPLPSMQSIDEEGRVVYLGSFSQSVSPALRISYMILPETLLPRWQERCGFWGISASALEQKALDVLLREGSFDRHINRVRTAYRQKRDVLVETLGKAFGEELGIRGQEAGRYLLVRLGEEKEEDLCTRAAEAGVRVYPVSPHYIGPVPKDAKGWVLLGYGGLSTQAIYEGVERLKSAWR